MVHALPDAAARPGSQQGGAVGSAGRRWLPGLRAALSGASAGKATVLPQLAAVAISAVLFTLIYDPFQVGAVVFLALTPITMVFTNPSWRCSLRLAGWCGLLFGLLASLAIVGPWMLQAAMNYFDYGVVGALGFTVLVNAVYVALFFVPAFAMIRLLAWTAPIIRVVGTASVWMMFESLRATAPASNPWATLGQGFVSLPIVREAAAYGGEPLLGWVAALCGAAIGVGLQPDVNAAASRSCMAIAMSALLALSAMGGIEHSRDHETSPISPLRVAIVQAEIPSRDVWDPAQRMAHWDSYVTATEALKPGTLDLVVWPESAVPFLLNADASAKKKLGELATAIDAAILLGAPRTEELEDGRAALYNSAYFFPPGSDKIRTYDKQRLLPYVETSPMGGADLPEGIEYHAGDRPVLFNLRGWNIAPLLCFEAVYPEYARQAVLDGASLFVNLSNDAWFAGGYGPEQHYAMSRMRTVDYRRAMVRASNGGISGAIGPDGAEIGFPVKRAKSVGLYQIPAPSRRTTVTAALPWAVPTIFTLLALLTSFYGLQRIARQEGDGGDEDED